jgi:starvation-inducible outer membrane lipoprotein
MNTSIRIILSVAAISTALLLSACNEGPAEKKGRQMDETVQQIKDNVQDKGPAQKAGEKIDRASEN